MNATTSRLTTLVINPALGRNGYMYDNLGKNQGFQYLHGQLAECCGYDDFMHVGYEPSTDGVYPCVVLGYQDRPAVYYFWQTSSIVRGLVVFADDVEGIEYAQRMFETRTTLL